MAKAEFLMLAHDYNPKKHRIAGWYMSEKLDGQRVLWDGGITRGLSVKDVPFANRDRDYRYINQDIRATGLWSRYGKIIQAPSWWLDKLPPTPLDGELYAGHKRFQFVTSVASQLVPDNRWHDLKYHIFDLPSYRKLFSDRDIEFRIGNNITKLSFKGVLNWARELPQFESNHVELAEFDKNIEFLKAAGIENDVVKIHEQIQLPSFTPHAEKMVEEELDKISDCGGEGLMLRMGISIWTPERSHNLVKVKRLQDAEGTVVGYVWGRETDKGSKLLGKMGSMVVEWNGKRFELSGFDYMERELVYKCSGNLAADMGRIFAGKPVDHTTVENKMFPIGSMVTFKYRELTDAGIPKEARYLRKYRSL
jgi:DNA ligase 1